MLINNTTYCLSVFYNNIKTDCSVFYHQKWNISSNKFGYKAEKI